MKCTEITFTWLAKNDMATNNLIRTLWAAICIGVVSRPASADEMPDYRVTMAGYGPIRIGMTVRQLEAVIGRKVAIPPEYDEACSFVDLTDIFGLRGTHAMLLDGRIARLDFDTKDAKTLSGVSIGDSAKKILSAYGSTVLVQPHAYTAPDGSYYTIYSKDRLSGVRFETDRGVVVTFYAGSSEAIQFIEGCQ